MKVRLIALTLALAAMVATSFAAPLVFDVKVNTSVYPNTIDYRLLEAADTVDIQVFGPLPATTLVGTISGTAAAGLNSVVWTGSPGGNPTIGGENYGFRIIAAETTGYSVYTQINNLANTAFHFEYPRGLAVNKNMDSDNFGMLYISNPRALATASARPMSDGVYGFFPDGSDPLGIGNTAATGTINWGLSTTASPFKLKVGPDDYLYVGDWSDAHGGLWRAPSDLTGTWETVLDNTGQVASGLVAGLHGSIAGLWLEESGSDVVVNWVDEDLASGTGPSDGLRCVFSQTITGSTVLPITTAPTLVIDENNFSTHPLFDGTIGIFVNDAGGALARDKNGNWYVGSYRAAGDNFPCLMQISSDGQTMLWDSRTSGTATTTDPTLLANWGIAIDDVRELVYYPCGSTTAGVFGFMVLDYTALPIGNLGSGGGTYVQIPEITAASSGGVDVDAAGNLYVSSNISERVHIFSPPGPSSFTFERASLTLAGGAATSANPIWNLYD